MKELILTIITVLGVFVGLFSFIYIYRLFWRLSPKWFNGKDPKKQLSKTGLMANRLIVGGLAAALGAIFVTEISIKAFALAVALINTQLNLFDTAGSMNPVEEKKMVPRVNIENNIKKQKMGEPTTTSEDFGNLEKKQGEGPESVNGKGKMVSSEVEEHLEVENLYDGDDPIIRKRLGLPEK